MYNYELIAELVNEWNSGEVDDMESYEDVNDYVNESLRYYAEMRRDFLDDYHDNSYQDDIIKFGRMQ